MGLFDSPILRAKRASAKNATALREQAAREATIEIQLLAKRHHQSWSRYGDAIVSGAVPASLSMLTALNEAQALNDRASRLADGIPVELAELTVSLRTSADYEALTAFELEAYRCLLALTSDARLNLGTLGSVEIDVLGAR